MTARSALARIHLRWTPRRVALDFIYRLHIGQLNAAVLTGVLAHMKKDVLSRFHPSQAQAEYAGAVRYFLLLVEIYAAAICPVLDAIADVARLLTSTLMRIEFGQVGPRSRLTMLVDARNQLLLRVAVMDKILLKHGLNAAVPPYIAAVVFCLEAQVLLTCRLLTELKMENIGLLDNETLMQQAENELARLEFTARQAAGAAKLSETARAICEKEFAMTSRFTDLNATSEDVYEEWRQRVDTWGRAPQKPGRRTPRSKAKSRGRSEAKSESRSKSKSKPPAHRRQKK